MDEIIESYFYDVNTGYISANKLYKKMRDEKQSPILVCDIVYNSCLYDLIVLKFVVCWISSFLVPINDLL